MVFTVVVFAARLVTAETRTAGGGERAEAVGGDGLNLTSPALGKNTGEGPIAW